VTGPDVIGLVTAGVIVISQVINLIGRRKGVIK